MPTPTSDTKLTHRRQQAQFFALCWTAYFSTYIGRLNFTASLALIAQTSRFPLPALGMVSSGFFIGYGVFQLIWGVLGDRMDPVKIVFSGVFGSGLCNLAMALCPSAGWMAALWTVNGVVQSSVWSPLLRLTMEQLPSHQAMTFSVRYSTTVPAGTFAAYALSALCAAFGSWRWVFVCSGVILLGIGTVWLLGMERLGIKTAAPQPQGAVHTPSAGHMPWLLLVPIGAAAAANGLIRDALQTWTPAYLTQIHGVNSAGSIALTLILPIINLGGVYLGKRLNDRLFHSEPVTAGVCMALTGAALALTLPGLSIWLDLGLFGICTALMLAVNTMLVTLIPMRLGRFGHVSALSGLLNSATYAGSVLSGWGVGKLLEHTGWHAVVLGGCGCALTASALCFAALLLWKNILGSRQKKGVIQP